MDEKRKFDEIIQLSLPLILFAPLSFSNGLIGEIRGLYEFYNGLRQPGFNNSYENIIELINEREKFSDTVEDRINSYKGRTQRIDDRIDNLEKIFNQLGTEKVIEQIKANKNNISRLEKKLFSWKKRERDMSQREKIRAEVNDEGKKIEEELNVTPIEISPQKDTKMAPHCICGKKIFKTGQRWVCDRRRSGCGRYYKKDKDGRLYRTEKGNKIFASVPDKKSKKECK